jgi:hypothetical protein
VPLTRCPSAPDTFRLTGAKSNVEAFGTNRARPANRNRPGGFVVVVVSGEPPASVRVTDTQPIDHPSTIGDQIRDTVHTKGIGMATDDLDLFAAALGLLRLPPGITPR